MRGVLRMTPQAESDKERRRRRRALIRAHHPDRGGDPAALSSVLQCLDEGALLGGEYPQMRFAHRRRWWQVSVTFPPLRRAVPRPKRVVWINRAGVRLSPIPHWRFSCTPP